MSSLGDILRAAATQADEQAAVVAKLTAIPATPAPVHVSSAVADQIAAVNKGLFAGVSANNDPEGFAAAVGVGAPPAGSATWRDFLLALFVTSDFSQNVSDAGLAQQVNADLFYTTAGGKDGANPSAVAFAIGWKGIHLIHGTSGAHYTAAEVVAHQKPSDAPFLWTAYPRASEYETALTTLVPQMFALAAVNAPSEFPSSGVAA